MKKLTVLFLFSVLVYSFSYSQLLPGVFRYSELRFTSGFVLVPEFNYGLGLGVDNPENDYNKGMVGITAVLAYQMRRSFITGVGTGILLYQDKALVPMYISERYAFPVLSSKILPYVNVDSGFLLSFEELITRTKLFFNPGIGAVYRVNSNLSANLGTSLFIQMGPRSPRDTYINFKMGVTFLIIKP